MRVARVEPVGDAPAGLVEHDILTSHRPLAGEGPVFFVQGWSSDGSRVSFHLVTHYTITGTGMEFGFEKPSC